MTYLLTTELSEKHFKKICGIVYQFSGINLKKGKEALVKTRLMKRLRKLQINSFNDYFDYIESKEGQSELGLLIDVMTTNKTSFFRESAHFDFLNDTVLPKLKKNKIRIWSAACSSGQEPYSIALVLRDNMPDIDSRDVRLLATDISKSMLEIAYRGIYPTDQFEGLSKAMVNKHFTKINTGSSTAYKVKDNIRNLITFASLNLQGKWPMKGLFDVIFCRNVMIYFDRPTQQTLVDRFWHMLEPGGYLFVGHSEGLSAVKHRYEYVKAATYRK